MAYRNETNELSEDELFDIARSITSMTDMSIKLAATLVDHQPVDALRAMVRDPEAALRDHYDISVAPIDRPRGSR